MNLKISTREGKPKRKKGKKASFLKKPARTSNTFKILQQLKTPSRLEITPYYKKFPKTQKKERKKNPRKKSPLIRRSFFHQVKPVFKTNLTNLCKTNNTNISLNKSCALSVNSNQERKIYKLSDFGLCVNINRSKPLQFGCNSYLAPEICQRGPDSSQVCGGFFQGGTALYYCIKIRALFTNY